MKQSAALAACVLRATTKKGSRQPFSTFFEEKSGFSDLEMTWLLYCAAFAPDDLSHDLSDLEMTWLP